ncbi:MAG TPA: glycosyltransferase [Candidatus Limnocylindria bacterium]|nr:glycosyltransferase [Candidatus Limnocylindria bacterium]
MKSSANAPAPARKLRVLIATVTAGAGHLQAAAALQEAWTAMRPDDVVEKQDVLEFTPKLFRKLYSESYLKLIEHSPELWGALFRKSDDQEKLERLGRVREMLGRLNASKFVAHMAEFRPDVILCTHYLPEEILGGLKAKGKLQPWPLVVSIVTDFEAHALWQEPVVDFYCVAAEHTKARLVARGIPTGNVIVTGIPVSVRFRNAPVRKAARKQLGLRDDLPVLLVLGGGFGVGPVAEILSVLNKVTEPIQLAVVCGRNQDLLRELAAVARKHPTHLLGFVRNMQDWMSAADLIVTKPGGLTSSEALALGRPLVILNPIPGQEEANSDFLLEHGAAVKLNRVEDLPFKLGQLLGDARLTALTKGAKALGQPEAAEAVCRAALDRLR